MDQIQLLNSKREQFHLQIRKRKLQDIFNKKRVFQVHDDFQKPQYLELVNQFNYDMADSLRRIIILLNDKPIICMVDNQIAAIIMERCLNIKEAQSWDFFKDCLKYIGLLSRLESKFLSPYLKQFNGLQGLIQCFYDTVTQIKQVEILIKGNDDNYPLQNGYSIEDRLSYTYNMLIQILTLITQDCDDQREILLKDIVFLECLFKVAQIKQDQAVLVSSLNLFGQILTDLKDQKETKLLQKISSMIRPLCQALRTPNATKKHIILYVLLQFSKVNVEYAMSYSLIKHNIVDSLITTMQNNNNQAQIDIYCMKIMYELIQQTPTYTKLLYEKGFMEVIRQKIFCDQQNILSNLLFLFQNLVEFQKDMDKEVYKDIRIIHRLIDIVQYFEVEARDEALFTLCAIARISNIDQLILLYDLKVNHIIVDYLGSIQNKELQEYIMKTIMIIIDQDKPSYNEFSLITIQMKQKLQNIQYSFDSPQIEQFLQVINYL